MKINIAIKRIIPIMLVMGILFTGFSTCVFAAGEEDLFAKHVSVSENVTTVFKNIDGTATGTDPYKFQNNGNVKFAASDGILNVTNNITTTGLNIARFSGQMTKASLPAYNKKHKLIIESKMRVDSAMTADVWFNIGISAGIPDWNKTDSVAPLAAIKPVSAADKRMKVRLGGFKNANVAESIILEDIYPEGEFISYKITIDVPEGAGDTDKVPVSYEINGIKQDFTAYLPVSMLKAVYGAKQTDNRITWATVETYSKSTSKNVNLAWSVDDVTATVIEDVYSRTADFTAIEALPSNFISSSNAAAPIFDGENGIKFNATDSDQFVCFKSNGKYLSEYNKPFVAETRIKFDPFDNKGQLRIQARGRDSKNGTNAGNQQGTLTLMTFNRGSIVLRQNVNPSSTTPDSIKIGEFKEDTWYNVKLIFSITDEKMYAYVYTDDYSYETAGVTDIPLEKMYSYNLASLAEINSLGVFSGTSNGGRATSYVSDFKMYAADVEQGEIEYIEAQTPDSVKDAARVSFSDIVDLTKLNMTIQHNGEEYTDYKTQLEGDGSTLAIVPSAEWKAGSYTIKFNDTVKGYFGGECEVNDIDFALNAVKEFTALSEYRYEGDNKGSFNYAAMPEYIDETAVADEAGFHFINLVDDKVAETPVEIWDVSVTDKIGSMQTFYYEINNVSLTNANGTPADKVGFYAIPWVRIDGQVYSGKAFTYGGSGFTESEKGKVVQETRTFK